MKKIVFLLTVIAAMTATPVLAFAEELPETEYSVVTEDVIAEEETEEKSAETQVEHVAKVERDREKKLLLKEANNIAREIVKAWRGAAKEEKVSAGNRIKELKAILDGAEKAERKDILAEIKALRENREFASLDDFAARVSVNYGGASYGTYSIGVHEMTAGLGASISYDAATGTITVSKGDQSVEITVNEGVASARDKNAADVEE